MLARILDAFENSNVPEALARTMLPRIDVPCNRWAVELTLTDGLATPEQEGGCAWYGGRLGDKGRGDEAEVEAEIEAVVTQLQADRALWQISELEAAAGEIEAWGRGMKRIVDACREAGAPRPKVQYSPGDLWFEFSFSPAYLDMNPVLAIPVAIRPPKTKTAQTK